MKCTIHGSSTHDARLFSAIAAMGLPWTEGDSAEVEGGDRVWLFGEVSDCGLWKIGELLAWWRDREFHVKNPAHPFHVVKSVMASDRGMREAFRNHTGYRQVKRGDSFITLSCDESFSGKPSKGNASTDTAFLASASAVGFNVTEGASQGNTRVSIISDRSETYPYSFKEIETWWRDETFEGRNPQHPYAYAKAVAITYLAAIDAIKKDRPLVKWKPDGCVGKAFIHPDCDSETEEKISNMLKGE